MAYAHQAAREISRTQLTTCGRSSTVRPAIKSTEKLGAVAVCKKLGANGWQQRRAPAHRWPAKPRRTCVALAVHLVARLARHRQRWAANYIEGQRQVQACPTRAQLHMDSLATAHHAWMLGGQISGPDSTRTRTAKASGASCHAQQSSAVRRACGEDKPSRTRNSHNSRK